MEFIRKTAFVLTSLALAVTVHAQTGQGKGETVRVQDYPGPGNVMVRVAAKKGICEKYGIKCEVKQFANGPLGAQAFLAGDIEIAFAPTEVILQATTKGADIKIIAGGVSGSPFFLSVLTGADTPNAAKGYPAVMTDFKGKKIGVPARGSQGEQQLIELLDGAGMKASDVTMIPIGGPATAMPALLNKQVDGIMMFTPIDGMCEVTKACRIVVDIRKGEAPKALTNTVGASTPHSTKGEYAAKNPHVIAAFRSALRDAHTFIMDPKNLKEVTDITEGYFKIDQPKGREMLEVSVKGGLLIADPVLKPSALQAIADYMFDNKMLPAKVDTSKLILK